MHFNFKQLYRYLSFYLYCNFHDILTLELNNLAENERKMLTYLYRYSSILRLYLSVHFAIDSKKSCQ